MKDDALHPSREDLFAYRDGELSHEKRTILEAHVMGCSDCRSLIDQVSSLEAELRRAADDVPAEYWERMPEVVRERIASAAREEAAARARGPRIERRRAEGSGRRGEGGRIGTAPRLPWAAVLSTGSAAAAVLVVVVILVNRGAFRSAVSPLPPHGAEVRQAPKVRGRAGALETPGRVASPGALGRAGTPAPAESAVTGQPAALAALAKPSTAPAPGSEYEAVARGFGLPRVWDDRVLREALERAEPRLRLLYQMGKAGADSARVRLYLAEAARLRYTPGDSVLYDRIVHHYRRATRLGGSDSEVARVAEERLKTLER